MRGRRTRAVEQDEEEIPERVFLSRRSRRPAGKNLDASLAARGRRTARERRRERKGEGERKAIKARARSVDSIFPGTFTTL